MQKASIKFLITTLLCVILIVSSTANALSLEKKLAKALIQEIKQQLLEKNLELADADQFAFAPESRCTNVASSLNVRTAPGGSVVKTLGNNVAVTVYETLDKDGSKWARIGDNQWVSAQFLKMACPSTPTPTPVTPTTPTKPTTGDSKTGDKAAEALSEIFKSEGKCQNWASDSGNSFQGKIGYTCMGVIPAECWNNRNGIFAPLAAGYTGHPADFCYYAYNKNIALYKTCSAKLYTTNYFAPGGCSNLPQPAFYVCADIAVNSGTGRSRQYLTELGGYKGQDAKAFARLLNERHRKDYLIWGRPGTKNNTFLKGWLARADARAKYIDTY